MGATGCRFDNRVVFITGAASGIGASTSLLFAAEAATVDCADIDAAGCFRTADEAAMVAGVELVVDDGYVL